MDVERHLSSLTCVAVHLDVYTQSCSELVPGHQASPPPHYRTINKTWGPQDAICEVVYSSVCTDVCRYAKYVHCPVPRWWPEDK